MIPIYINQHVREAEIPREILTNGMELKIDPHLPPHTIEMREDGRFIRGNLATGEIVEGKFVDLDFSDVELKITALTFKE